MRDVMHSCFHSSCCGCYCYCVSVQVPFLLTDRQVLWGYLCLYFFLSVSRYDGAVSLSLFDSLRDLVVVMKIYQLRGTGFVLWNLVSSLSLIFSHVCPLLLQGPERRLRWKASTPILS